MLFLFFFFNTVIQREGIALLYNSLGKKRIENVLFSLLVLPLSTFNKNKIVLRGYVFKRKKVHESIFFGSG